MKENQDSLTTRGINGPYFLLIALSVIGMAISLYLTGHYLDVKFPQALVEGSACDINDFFNCDASSLSALSNLWGMPISGFGLLFFINLIASCIFPNARWERSNHLLAWVNVGGCLILLLYTLFFLNSACPFCIGHWVISLLIALLFWKKALPPALPALPVVGIYAGLAVLVLGTLGWNIRDKQNSNTRLATALIRQFDRKPLLEEPNSEHKIHQLTQNFADAPFVSQSFPTFSARRAWILPKISPLSSKGTGKKLRFNTFFIPWIITAMKTSNSPFTLWPVRPLFWPIVRERSLQRFTMKFLNAKTISPKNGSIKGPMSWGSWNA